MRTERGLQFEKEETVGHEVEKKVAQFMQSSFDCIDDIQETQRYGVNDSKGIDFVVTFENGGAIAIDVTADMGVRVDEKIKSMKRNPLVSVAEERNDDREVTVEKSQTLVPRALIRVDGAKWAEYNIETIGNEVIVYMPDAVRIKEEKDMLGQLFRQIEYFSKESIEYKKAATKIKSALQESMQEVEALQ